MKGGVDMGMNDMDKRTSYRLFMRTMDWAEIRAFIVRRKWLRDEIEPEIYDQICSGQTNYLTGNMMRELSVYIAGYQMAKGKKSD